MDSAEPMGRVTGTHTPRPTTASEAMRRLEEGNRRFAELAAGQRQVVEVPTGALSGDPGAHVPFAVVVGCADARVPAELIFGQGVNDLFVIRIAGNGAAPEAVGSVAFAVDNLPTVRLVAVVGHTGCGAVAAAVDAHLGAGLPAEPGLRAIVERIAPTMKPADAALRQIYGGAVTSAPAYRTALSRVAVALHAASTAGTLRRTFGQAGAGFAFGVYDVGTKLVGPGDGERGLRLLDREPIEGAAFAARLAGAPGIRQALHGDGLPA